MSTLPVFMKNRPLSSNGPQVQDYLRERIGTKTPALAKVRYSYAAGYGEHFILWSFNDYLELIGSLKPRDSVTLFFIDAFPFNKILSNQDGLMLQDILDCNDDETGGICVIIFGSDLGDEPIDYELIFITTHQEITELLQSSVGKYALAGPLRFWESNQADLFTVYVPDSDGEVRLGAY